MADSDSIRQKIGKMPLVKLNNFPVSMNSSIYAKTEYLHLVSSNKDRMVDYQQQHE